MGGFESMALLAREARKILKDSESHKGLHITDGVKVDDLEDYQCLMYVAELFKTYSTNSQLFQKRS